MPETRAQIENGSRAGLAWALGDITRSSALELHVRGDCMAPGLRDGDRVRIVAKSFYMPGDILAFSGADSRLLMHRLLGYRPTRKGWRIVTAADSANGIDPSVPPDRIIGRVIEVSRCQPLRTVETESRTRVESKVSISVRERAVAAGRFTLLAFRWLLRRRLRQAPSQETS